MWLWTAYDILPWWISLIISIYNCIVFLCCCYSLCILGEKKKRSLLADCSHQVQAECTSETLSYCWRLMILWLLVYMLSDLTARLSCSVQFSLWRIVCYFFCWSTEHLVGLHCPVQIRQTAVLFTLFHTDLCWNFLLTSECEHLSLRISKTLRTKHQAPITFLYQPINLFSSRAAHSVDKEHLTICGVDYMMIKIKRMWL